jgi:hypothetical protein
MRERWQRGELTDSGGVVRRCIFPVVVSASRATDIPAFYGEWFANRLRAGYCIWRNPFNGREQYVSFEKTRVFVFWTKYAAPFEPVLDLLDARGIHYYFLHTLNDYAACGLEPGVPSLSDRVAGFIRLSDRLGAARVCWRFDPLVLVPGAGAAELLARVEALGRQLAGHTERLIISFVDIVRYRSVQRNLARSGVETREWTLDEMRPFSRELARMASGWGMAVRTCAEDADLGEFGVLPSACIDGVLMRTCWPEDVALGEFLDGLGPRRKDSGQRSACGCLPAKDIGHYNTCRFGCSYCYACHSPAQVAAAVGRHDPEAESLA